MRTNAGFAPALVLIFLSILWGLFSINVNFHVHDGDDSVVHDHVHAIDIILRYVLNYVLERGLQC